MGRLDRARARMACVLSLACMRNIPQSNSNSLLTVDLEAKANLNQLISCFALNSFPNARNSK